MTASPAGARVLISGIGALTLTAAIGIWAGHASFSGGPDAAAASQATLASLTYQNSHLMHFRRASRHVVTGQRPVRIRIPAIALNSPIIPTELVGGTTWQVADWAVGDLIGSANPGACTTWLGIHDCTTALSAHDDIKGELFRRNIELKPGDKILLYTKGAVFTYRVNARYVVTPYNSSDLFSTTKSVALVSCTPYWVDTSRLVVTGKLVSARLRPGR